ncbi:hypothetical protein D5086_012644 [Populus alba]|uniref:Uncharacterized protein n=1 Tax=Populus alba TaxID=43335 RepID=A0ACC4C412_POPAL
MVQNSPSLPRIVVSIMEQVTADNSLADSGSRHMEVGNSAPHNFSLTKQWRMTGLANGLGRARRDHDD